MFRVVTRGLVHTPRIRQWLHEGAHTLRSQGIEVSGDPMGERAKALMRGVASRT